MNKIKFLVKASLFASIIFLLPSLAEAQATRTWVSGVGSDANPCSRTAPCLTFAGAFVKTAVGGEINCLDAGGFGGLTITNSITIDCRGETAGVITGAGTQITINTVDSVRTVRLKGLNINGVGGGAVGIKIINAANVDIENTVVEGFSSHGISVENTTDVNVTVSNSKIRNNGGHGINVAPASGSLITSVAANNVTVDKNYSGVVTVGKGRVVIANSLVTGSLAYGLYALDADMTAISTTVAFNNIGIQSDNLANIKINNITVSNNIVGVRPNVGNIISFKNNSILGNVMDLGPNLTANQQ